MKHLSARVGTVLFVLLAASSGPIRADYLNWTYTTATNVPGIAADSTSPHGGATVTFSSFNTPQASAAGSIPVQAYVTSTDSTTPIAFGPSTSTPSTFSLAMTITDGTTHQSGTLTFIGSLSGALTATSSSVIASFTPATTNSLTLDGHKYTVNILPTPLAPPTLPQKDISATISVSNGQSGGGGGNLGGGGGNNGGSGGNHGGGQGNGVPEPASLLLGSLGLSYLGMVHWAKRRSALRCLSPIA